MLKNYFIINPFMTLNSMLIILFVQREVVTSARVRRVAQSPKINQQIKQKDFPIILYGLNWL